MIILNIYLFVLFSLLFIQTSNKTFITNIESIADIFSEINIKLFGGSFYFFFFFLIISQQKINK